MRITGSVISPRGSPAVSSAGAYSQQLFDKISMTIMAVGNMDQAKAFYAGKLGFKVLKDYSGGGYRWVTVVPPGGGASITLSTYFANLKPGTMQLYLSTSDIEAAHRELAARGVKVTEIGNDLYGPGSGTRWFGFDDPDGNHWIVWQESK